MSVPRDGFILNYDREHDVLYVSVGTPKPSYCAKDNNGVLIRKAFDNDRLSGITIMDFSRKTIAQLKRAIPRSIDLEEILRLSRDQD